jgi:PAS domain S-box-containing protein
MPEAASARTSSGIEVMSTDPAVSVAFGEPNPSIASLIDAEAILVRGTENERQLRAALDALPTAIYTTDAAGRITYYNQAAADLAGREPQLGKDEWCVTWRLYNPDGTPMPLDRCPMAVALKENRPVRGIEAILERPDGTRIPIRPYPTPLRDGSGALVGAVNLLLDLSDRKLAENASAYLAAIVASSDDAIVSKNLSGIVTSWNRGAEAIFGYRADEVVGRPISLLFPPDRLAEEDLILERIRRGEQVDHFETVRRRKDGREIDVSLTISPVRDDCGRIIGISKIARDITDKKRAEATLRDLNENLERRVAERTHELAEAHERLMTEMAEREHTEAQLLQAQKMEAVGQLASGLAHDFNNLLAAILGNLELLEMRLPDQGLLKLVQAAARSARRGATLNEQLLAFSRKQHLAPKPVDVNALIIGLGDLLRRTLGGTVEVATALAGDLWPALVDPHQLELVLLNLAINGRDAMPLGGKMRIESGNARASELDASLGLAPGDYVVITVADTGTGMTPEILARACEPFFTTKEPGKGSGLGLAQVYGVARQSGGGLRLKSAVGTGTTVELYLPRSLAQVMPAAESRKASVTPVCGRRTRVLVVDDNEEVREVIVAYLDALDCPAMQAASGRTALEFLADNPGAIDLLMADYAMPGMSGIELVQAVRAKCPALPAIIVTGYADTRGFDSGADAILLKKPFRMNDLAATVELALSRGTAIARTASTVVPLRAARRR